MNRKITVLLISLLLLGCMLIGIAGCTPKTEDKCEHNWKAATCTAPKTCTLCSATEGEALGHSGGTATETEKAICEVCGQPYGELKPQANTSAGCTGSIVSTVFGVISLTGIAIVLKRKRNE